MLPNRAAAFSSDATPRSSPTTFCAGDRRASTWLFSPLPQPASAKAAVQQGLALFQGKGQCIKCHRREALDDDRAHDIGTRGPNDVSPLFDTPALLGVARTAPYLHDGRAETIADAVALHGGEGRTAALAYKRLSIEERDQVELFLQTLAAPSTAP